MKAFAILSLVLMLGTLAATPDTVAIAGNEKQLAKSQLPLGYVIASAGDNLVCTKSSNGTNCFNSINAGFTGCANVADSTVMWEALPVLGTGSFAVPAGKCASEDVGETAKLETGCMDVFASIHIVYGSPYDTDGDKVCWTGTANLDLGERR